MFLITLYFWPIKIISVSFYLNHFSETLYLYNLNSFWTFLVRETSFQTYRRYNFQVILYIWPIKIISMIFYLNNFCETSCLYNLNNFLTILVEKHHSKLIEDIFFKSPYTYDQLKSFLWMFTWITFVKLHICLIWTICEPFGLEKSNSKLIEDNFLNRPILLTN